MKKIFLVPTKEIGGECINQAKADKVANSIQSVLEKDSDVKVVYIYFQNDDEMGRVFATNFSKQIDGKIQSKVIAKKRLTSKQSSRSKSCSAEKSLRNAVHTCDDITDECDAAIFLSDDKICDGFYLKYLELHRQKLQKGTGKFVTCLGTYVFIELPCPDASNLIT